MKISDDYKAKLLLWARRGEVVKMPRIADVPNFGCKRFSSGAEMNAWKKELLEQIAQQGGVKWTN